MVPGWLQGVVTPLVCREWNLEIMDHTNAVFQYLIMKGIWNGFRIGFDRRVHCAPAPSNMCSASDNASVVQEYLEQEVNLGPIDGPVSLEMVPIRTQLSLFGVIPKSNQPRKWCLIVDLSSLVHIASAYHMVPVQPRDRPLLAVQWG